MNSHCFTVAAEHACKRLDVYLSRVVPGLTRSYAKKLINDGRVLVEGQVSEPARRLRAGEEVTVVIPPPQPAPALPEMLPLDLVYEDADLVVVNKARGMVVHPAAGHDRGTLVNALLYHCPDLAGINDTVRPGIVHRLDKDTTGLLVVAKTQLAQQQLAAQIKDRSVTRRYLALVHGIPRCRSGEVDLPVGRHPVHRQRMAVVARGGRPAVTRYAVEEALGRFALVQAELLTGRTHQVRVHLAHLGHPVVADAGYGGRAGTLGMEGQALHAAFLGLAHPRTGVWLEFQAPLPRDFQRALSILRARCLRQR
ncbi:MAG TPA: RNA pseudouridine synthase [Clostridiales bacterium UBA8153]|nr:RNA pseudouridine synthase [Clostridiales bacterium UBA8153]